MRPPSGHMVWWRPKDTIVYRFGYVTYERGDNLVRMGRWNGDTMGGSVVDHNDIDWKEYTNP